MEHLFTEEVDGKNGDRPEQRGHGAEREHGIPEKRDGNCLDVDEQSLSAEVVLIEELRVARLKDAERICTVHGLIGVESGGDGIQGGEAEGASENDDTGEEEVPARAG